MTRLEFILSPFAGLLARFLPEKEKTVYAVNFQEEEGFSAIHRPIPGLREFVERLENEGTSFIAWHCEDDDRHDDEWVIRYSHPYQMLREPKTRYVIRFVGPDGQAFIRYADTYKIDLIDKPLPNKALTENLHLAIRKTKQDILEYYVPETKEVV